MSNLKSTFLDLPLEKDLYVRKPLYIVKSPIRVLVTDAGNKTAYCLIYKICTGCVFGPDQEIYIHMVNSKGVIDHKAMFFELEECGFHLLKGLVVTSTAEEAYKDVDIVIYNSGFEEQSGFSYRDAIATQIIRGRQIMKNVVDNCSPDVKMVVVGPSSKSSLILLLILHRLEPKFPIENLTAVTLLDEAIARANLAARLKTTTNKIKNIVIWGATCPDVANATVRMFPPGDQGALEEVEIPVHEALMDDNYLHDEFVESIYRRKLESGHSKNGKSVAVAIARHLKALFRGTTDDEIISMGVLTPDSEPYSVPKDFCFSYPVSVKHGKCEVKTNVKYDVRTHLNLLRTVESLTKDETVKSIITAINYVLEYERTRKDIIRVNQRQEIAKILGPAGPEFKYYLTPLPYDSLPKPTKDRVKVKRSIVWEDSQYSRRSDDCGRKSSIRFSVDESRKTEKRGSILKNTLAKDVLVLPPLDKNHKPRSD